LPTWQVGNYWQLVTWTEAFKFRVDQPVTRKPFNSGLKLMCPLFKLLRLSLMIQLNLLSYQLEFKLLSYRLQATQ
jgi:hypothetical protein